jgi:GAF domain-containing protein
MDDHELELELLRSELETLYKVSQVLSRSLDLKETLTAVLRALHDGVGMERGMVSLLEPESGELQVSVAHGLADVFTEEIRYRPGEGVVGMILEEGEPIALERIADEPRFLSKLGLYDPERGFVGVPIRSGHQVVGVLAAQTAEGAEVLLDEYTQFMEMVANLIGQTVRLSADVQKERQELTEERDTLRTHRARPIRLRQHHRPHPADAAGIRTGAPGRQMEHYRADSRRNRHRQGTHRQRHPLQLAARQSALRQAQLRRAAGKPAGKRTVRPRKGRIHRRHGAAQRPLRAGRRRYAVPR